MSRYLDDQVVRNSIKWVENQIQPSAPGRKNWLFAGSLHGGKLASMWTLSCDVFRVTFHANRPTRALCPIR
ncbi:transposase [Pseudomonas syringae]|nr:transposase [Pseudomonas syringae]